jgi:hypothetical protein
MSYYGINGIQVPAIGLLSSREFRKTKHLIQFRRAPLNRLTNRITRDAPHSGSSFPLYLVDTALFWIGDAYIVGPSPTAIYWRELHRL